MSIHQHFRDREEGQRWHIHAEGKTYGPFTVESLRDMVRKANHIISVKLAINESIEAAAKMRWSGTIKFNQFVDGHQRLKNAQQDGLKVEFVARKILFAEGSVKRN